MQVSSRRARINIEQILKEEQSKLGSLPATDQSYERIIVRVGTAMLNEHLPQILPYMVGSKFLHRSEDGSFVAAFFVFDIAGLIVDIPVFLINGSVKGYEILYVRDSKIFLPSLSEVLDFLKSQQEEKSGEPSIAEGANRIRRASVNSSIYSHNNRFLNTAKSAGYYDRLVDEAADSFRGIMEDAGTVHEKTGSLFESPDWLAVLSHRGARDQARKLAAICPSFVAKMASILGREDWVDAINEYEQSLYDSIKSATLRIDSSLASRKFIGLNTNRKSRWARFDDLQAAAKVAGVMEAKKEFDTYGACLFEPETEVSKKAYVVTRPETYGTPTATGTYKVYTIDGKVKTVFVFLRESVRSYDDASVATLIDADDNSIAKIYTHEITADLSDDSAAVGDYGRGLYSRDLQKLTSSVRTEEPMVALFPDGTIYGPFKVRSQPNDQNEVFRIWNCHVSPQGKHMGIGNNRCGSSAFNVDQLVISDQLKNGPRVMELGERQTMFVPRDTKVIYVGAKNSSDYFRPKTFDLLPCSQFEQQELLKKAAFTLEGMSGPYCRLNNAMMTKADAIEKIASCGLTIRQCKELVDGARRSQSYIVGDNDSTLPEIAAGRKVAFALSGDDMPNDYQFGSPSQQPEGYGGNQIPIRELYNNSEHIPSESVQYADTGSAPWSSEQSPYNEPVVGGGDGGGNGRYKDNDAKEMMSNPERLFENAAFVNMINYVNPSVEREKLIESCIKSCTGAGRSYFLLLVHGDEFAEAYGLGDADELAGKLLTQLQGAGKILITLFSRSISAGSDLALSSMNPG